jgi:hypothetical protein
MCKYLNVCACMYEYLKYVHVHMCYALVHRAAWRRSAEVTTRNSRLRFDLWAGARSPLWRMRGPGLGSASGGPGGLPTGKNLNFLPNLPNFLPKSVESGHVVAISFFEPRRCPPRSPSDPGGGNVRSQQSQPWQRAMAALQQSAKHSKSDKAKVGTCLIMTKTRQMPNN